MRIVAFGCSYSYGQALPDCYDPVTHGGGPVCSKFAWPQILANQLNCDCINLSRPGSSNKEISYKIFDFDFRSTDIVVIMWTFLYRWYVLTENEPIRIRPSDNVKTSNNAYAYYNSNFFSKHDMYVDFVYRKNYVNMYLEKLNVKNYHLTTCLDEIMSMQQLHWDNVQLLPIDIIYYHSNNQPALDTATGNPHPGINAHKQLAIALSSQLKNDMSLSL